MLTMTMQGGELGGLTDWHILDTAAAIQNKRREGMTDAQITTWLLSDENKKSYGSACPWGCTQEKVAAAFNYLATGKLPVDVKRVTTTEQTHPSHKTATTSARGPSRSWLIGGVAAAAAITGIVLVARQR